MSAENCAISFDRFEHSFFSSESSKPNNISLIQLNIRSLRRNFNDFMITVVSQLQNKISIIVLTEIWISSEEKDFYQIPGYNCYACCNDTYRAGGVICFIDNKLEVIHLNTFKMITADTVLL